MPNKDTIQFLIGDKDYSQNLKSYDLRYDMFSGAASFEADLDILLDIRLCDYPRQFFWNINGFPMMTGFLDRVDRSYSKGDMSQRVAGRDMMQVLLDNYVLKFDTYTNVKIVDIIDTVWKLSSKITTIRTPVSSGGSVTKTLTYPLNLWPISFIVTSQATKKIKDFSYTSIKTSPGETLFSALSKLCNQIGLFMYNKPGTSNIIIHTIFEPENKVLSYTSAAAPTPDHYSIINTKGNVGNNVISCDFSEDITDYHKYIKLLGTAQQEEGFGKKFDAIMENTPGLIIEKLESQYLNTPYPDTFRSGYQGVTKFLVSEVNDIDVNTWYKKGSDIINNQLVQQNRSLFNVRYKVSNFSPDNSPEPYFFNHLVDVSDDFLNIGSAGFMVTGVDFRGSKNEGYTTDLTLTLPSTTEVPGLRDINSRTV